MVVDETVFYPVPTEPSEHVVPGVAEATRTPVAVTTTTFTSTTSLSSARAVRPGHHLARTTR
jgi:hypothetical protein